MREFTNIVQYFVLNNAQTEINDISSVILMLNNTRIPIKDTNVYKKPSSVHGIIKPKVSELLYLWSHDQCMNQLKHGNFQKFKTLCLLPEK